MWVLFGQRAPSLVTPLRTLPSAPRFDPGPETLLMVCGPQLSLERNEYRLQEMLPLRRFLENEILPAIHAELFDSLIASQSPTTPPPPCLAH
nr:unnamed protein product [Spirometra erinaceieuropaei]